MSPSSSRSLSWVLASASASWPSSAPSRASPSSAPSRTSSASVTSTSCWLTTGPPTVSLQKFALRRNPLRLLSVRLALGRLLAQARRNPLHSRSVSHNAHRDLRSRHRLPDRLLFACRTGCCRTTLAAGTSSWGSGSAFARPSRSSPRIPVPFCPVAGGEAVVAGRDAVPDRAVPVRAVPVRAVPVRAFPVEPEPDAVAPLARAEADPDAAVCRPLAVPLRAPLAAGLAPPAADLAPAAGRAEACRDEPVPDAAGRAGFCVVFAAPPVVAPATAPAAPTGWGSQFLNMMYCWPSVHRLVVTQ